MPASKIIVSHNGGRPAKNIKVKLGFHGIARGMSHSAYTNSNGVAIIEHSGRGRADVYISGKKNHTFTAPGTTAVTI